MALRATSDPFASCRKEFVYRMQYSFIFADSRIQESKRHRIPCPDPQHCFLCRIRIQIKTGSGRAEISGSYGSGSTARLVSSVIEIDCSAKPVNLDSLVRRALRIPALAACDPWQSSAGGRMRREEGEKSSASHLGKKGLHCQAEVRIRRTR
jgi:hypothetical protein